jgi:GNAT superfamily N-acetyltransferase
MQKYPNMNPDYMVWYPLGQDKYGQRLEEVMAGGLTETRNSLFAFVKQQFPTWPDYVLKDFLYPQAKGIRDQAELDDFLKRNKQDFGNCKWTLTELPITFDIFTPKTQRMLASREGGSSNPFQVPRDAERHAQQSQMIQQKGVSVEPIIVAKLSNGYDLIEGWHRTIQHLKAFPQGYTGPAWVCTGATYKSENVNQGVAEDRENFNGINLLLQKDDEEVFVKASAGGRELGHVLFVMDGDYLMPQDLEVEERYRGQGIAQTMYDFVKSKGYKIRRSGQQTDAGAGFWAKHRPEQNVWEEGVAESTDYLEEK